MNSPELQKLLEDGGRPLVDMALKEMPYDEYLRTTHWQQRRASLLKGHHHRCRLCDDWAVDVHHLSYENRGAEIDKELIPLCRGCHSLWHQNWVHVSNIERNKL